MDKANHYDGPKTLGIKALTTVLNMPGNSLSSKLRSVPINILWSICDCDRVATMRLTKAVWYWLIDRHMGKPKGYTAMYAQDCDGLFKCNLCGNLGNALCHVCKYN